MAGGKFRTSSRVDYVVEMQRGYLPELWLHTCSVFQRNFTAAASERKRLLQPGDYVGYNGIEKHMKTA